MQNSRFEMTTVLQYEKVSLFGSRPTHPWKWMQPALYNEFNGQLMQWVPQLFTMNSTDNECNEQQLFAMN